MATLNFSKAIELLSKNLPYNVPEAVEYVAYEIADKTGGSGAVIYAWIEGGDFDGSETLDLLCKEWSEDENWNPQDE